LSYCDVEFFLTRRRQRGEEARLAILAATSGDTGSAAISGLRGKDYVDCFVLYPNGRVSEIQEQQMATVPDANIHCIAIDGTFDDAQAIVKGAFKDIPFRDEVQLGAVNSINWARILAQITCGRAPSVNENVQAIRRVHSADCHNSLSQSGTTSIRTSA
jgi:threonine synthase